MGESSNLKKHLQKNHANTRSWISSYVSFLKRDSQKWKSNENLILLAKYFLTSNSAIAELKNPFLRQMLTFKLPCRDTFMNTVLPEIKDLIHKKIEEKLKEAKSVCLITDLWSNTSNSQYLALACSIVYNNFHKEIRVVGMVNTNGSSNAESIKICIEQIINQFEFDKTKIEGVVCDEGSALVRLFKQNENSLFDSTLTGQNDSSRNTTPETTENDEELSNQVSITPDNIDTEIQGIVNENEQFNFDEESDSDNSDYEPTDGENERIYESDFDSETDTDSDTENDIFLNEAYADHDKINFLSIELATNSVPRYSCTAHKLNLAVRSSIKMCNNFCTILTKLSQFATSIRRSNVRSKDFIKNKAKLRCENGTRWSSSYLMLESFFKAYKKNVFRGENKCPVALEKIKTYLKILHPLYTISILSQKSDWHIGDVIPGLIILLEGALDETEFRGEKKKLVKCLKKSVKKRFEFELNSKIYLLAALLNTNKLNLWFKKPYANEYTSKALESFDETVSFFLKDKASNVQPTQPQTSTASTSTSSISTENRALMALLTKSKNYESHEEVARFSLQEEIKKERIDFLNFIQDQTVIGKCTKSFWSEYGEKFPRLRQVALILFSIPASAAFIERFFSICGLVCDKRSMNMNPETLTEKILIRVNVDLLENKKN